MSSKRFAACVTIQKCSGTKAFLPLKHLLSTLPAPSFPGIWGNFRLSDAGAEDLAPGWLQLRRLEQEVLFGTSIPVSGTNH